MAQQQTHTPESCSSLPSEVLEIIFGYAGLTSASSILHTCRLWRRVELNILPSLLADTHTILNVTQETHWQICAKMKFVAFDPITHHALFEVANHHFSRFYYAILISRPILRNIKLTNSVGSAHLSLPFPPRLQTKKSGVYHATSPNGDASLLYRVQDNDDIGRIPSNPDHENDRWVTPLSFRCSIHLFANLYLTNKQSASPETMKWPTPRMLISEAITKKPFFHSSKAKESPFLAYSDTCNTPNKPLIPITASPVCASTWKRTSVISSQ
jgi:hypothetical protein